MSPDTPTVLFVCTGNAARSVMAATLLRRRTDRVAVESAGTHSIPGLPMSTRTRTALDELDATDPHHRSAQLDQGMGDRAAIVAVFEPMHLRYIRKQHPELAPRTASLSRLARDLGAGPLDSLAERIRSLELVDHEFEPWEEIVDPAGGELADFQHAAREIDGLIERLHPRLGS